MNAVLRAEIEARGLAGAAYGEVAAALNARPVVENPAARGKVAWRPGSLTDIMPLLTNADKAALALSDRWAVVANRVWSGQNGAAGLAVDRLAAYVAERNLEWASLDILKMANLLTQAGEMALLVDLVAVLTADGKIGVESAQRIGAKMAEQVDDPAWAATVAQPSWAEATLGRTVTAADVQEALVMG